MVPLECENISEEKYGIMKELEEERIHWFCSGCNKAVDVLKLVNNPKESNDKLHLRVDKMEDQLDTIENMKNETFRKETKNGKSRSV